MLFGEIIAVCSEIHTKHINTFARLNTKFPNIKPGGTYSYHWALRDRNFCLLKYDTVSSEGPLFFRGTCSPYLNPVRIVSEKVGRKFIHTFALTYQTSRRYNSEGHSS
jgi:hypothetical protein